MIGKKYIYPNDDKIFTLKDITSDKMYIFECGHRITNSVFQDLIDIKTGIQNYNLNNNNMNFKLKNPKTFSVSNENEIVTIEGANYTIANLQKSGITNQTIVLLGHGELWHEINVLDLGADNSNLTDFKNYVEKFQLTLVDLGVLKTEIVVKTGVTHDDHMKLSAEFPKHDYIQIGKLTAHYGERASVYLIREDLKMINEKEMTIDQWISEMEALKESNIEKSFEASNTTENTGSFKLFTERRKQLNELGLVVKDITAKNDEFIGHGFTVTEKSMLEDDNDTWNELIGKILAVINSNNTDTAPTAPAAVNETANSVKMVIIEKNQQPGPTETITLPKPSTAVSVINLEEISKLTPEKLSDLKGLKQSQELIVSQNPIIVVTDKKTLETAKKQRAILLKASTAIDGNTGVQATAKKYLNAFKSTLDNFLSSTAKITREAYDKQNSEIVKFEKAEELRILAEQQEKTKKLNSRTSELFAIPMAFNGSIYQVGTFYIMPSQIETATDEEFTKLVEQAKLTLQNIETEKLSKETEADRAMRLMAEKLKQLGVDPAELIAPAPPAIETVVVYRPSSNGPTESDPATNTAHVPSPDPISTQTPVADTSTGRFKPNNSFIEANPDNKILLKFDLDHLSAIQANPIPPSFIKCRAYFEEGNKQVALELQRIMEEENPKIKKSEQIIDLYNKILNQKQ